MYAAILSGANESEKLSEVCLQDAIPMSLGLETLRGDMSGEHLPIS